MRVLPWFNVEAEAKREAAAAERVKRSERILKAYSAEGDFLRRKTDPR